MFQKYVLFPFYKSVKWIADVIDDSAHQISAKPQWHRGTVVLASATMSLGLIWMVN